MAVNYQQTDSTTGVCTNCALASGDNLRAATGETAGSTPVSVTVTSTSTERISFTLIVATGTTGDSGSWSIPLNVTTANMNLALNGADVSAGRMNSSCIFQDEFISSGSWSSTDLGTTGVKTYTATGLARTFAAGDLVRICIGVTNSSMSNQAFSFTPNQIVVTPFNIVAPSLVWDRFAAMRPMLVRKVRELIRGLVPPRLITAMRAANDSLFRKAA